MEVIRPAENTAAERMTSGTTSSSAHIQHGMLQVSLKLTIESCVVNKLVFIYDMTYMVYSFV